MQTKKRSLLEAIVNTAAGFIVSLTIQMMLYPLLKIPVTLSENFLITTIFTGASIGRGYIIRRIFNK